MNFSVMISFEGQLVEHGDLTTNADQDTELWEKDWQSCISTLNQ